MSKKKPQPDFTDLILEYGIDVVKRELYVTGEVNEKMYRHVLTGLAVLNQKSSESILAVLNSTGGDLYSGLAIYDLLKSSPSPIDVHVVGTSMSAALIILQAGRVRSASPLSQFMMHIGSLGLYEDAATAHIQVEHDKKLRKLMQKLVTQRTKKQFKWSDRDRYMFADEALEAGLIDEIE